MARLLLIVSREQPARYTYLKHVFASEAVDVILDRRVGERRQRRLPIATDRRRLERRQRDIGKELAEFGWALVRQ